MGVLHITLKLKIAVGINTRTALKDTSLPTGGGPLGSSPVGILAGTTTGMFLLPFPTF
jgi:hypothetical protein